MLTSKAVGLAANQVGMDYNMITVLGPMFEGPMINPVILERSADVFHYAEGCLSVVGYELDIGKRSRSIKVQYYDLEGKKQEVELKDDTAVIVQHEIDHLLGKLMIDYLEPQMK